MPIVIFRATPPTVEDYITIIEGVIGTGHSISIQAGGESIEYVEILDITQTQMDAVEAALRTAYPRQTNADWMPYAPLTITDAAAQQWLNMPAAVTEFRGLTAHRVIAPLHQFVQARLAITVTVAGSTNAKIGVQASEDGGSTWKSLEGVADSAAPFVAINTTGYKISAGIDIALALRKDVLLRIAGVSGDGAVDPSFGLIQLQVR